MSTSDKVLLIGGVVIGAGLGTHFAEIIGGIVGGFAGLGVVSVGYAIVDEVNMRLREHYRTI
jgi:outer membrane lipoprotein SlyB